MLDTKQFVMQEIGAEAYLELRRAWTIPYRLSDPSSYQRFARILNPFIYSDFAAVCREAVETPCARRISVPLTDRGKGRDKWGEKLRLEEVAAKLHTIIMRAERFGFLYVHFRTRVLNGNHEMGFERLEGKVVSTNVVIPGPEVRQYEFYPIKGGIEHDKLAGLIHPQQFLRRYHPKPASASPPADQSSRPGQGQ